MKSGGEELPLFLWVKFSRQAIRSGAGIYIQSIAGFIL
jgi:hypothetical protein